jgi:hypothetical protein
MVIHVIKARDGVFDMFIDGEWSMSRSNPENIFLYLNEEPEPIEFYYTSLYDKMSEVI